MAFSYTSYTPDEIALLLRLGSRKHKEELTPAHDMLMQVKDQIYLFEEIDAKGVQSITRNVRIEEKNPGEPFFSSGETSTDIGFVLSGRVDLAVGEEKTVVSQVAAGNVFGETAFVTGKPRNISALASEEKTSVLMFEIDDNNLDDPTVYDFLHLFHNLAASLAGKVESSNTRVMRMPRRK